MSDALGLTLFAHVCDRPDDEIDLVEGALLLAEIDHPGVDHARARSILDELGRGAKAAIARAEAEHQAEEAPDMRDVRRLEGALRYLYEQAGFRGNGEDYYDPKNSFLDEVLSRRTGIPITLAVVLIEVGRRAGLDLRGVSFPGHFLVRAETPMGLLIVDPFGGRLLSRAELRALFARATGQDREPEAEQLEAAGPRQILLRMLANLRGIYRSRGDMDHLRAVLERMDVLAPSEELRRERQEIGGSAPFRAGRRSLN
ncbi:MAG: transglutaminase-like domain-containing protein [Byssovorax sp.]